MGFVNHIFLDEDMGGDMNGGSPGGIHEDGMGGADDMQQQEQQMLEEQMYHQQQMQ